MLKRVGEAKEDKLVQTYTYADTVAAAFVLGGSKCHLDKTYFKHRFFYLTKRGKGNERSGPRLSLLSGMGCLLPVCRRRWRPKIVFAEYIDIKRKTTFNLGHCIQICLSQHVQRVAFSMVNEAGSCKDGSLWLKWLFSNLREPSKQEKKTVMLLVPAMLTRFVLLSASTLRIWLGLLHRIGITAKKKSYRTKQIPYAFTLSLTNEWNECVFLRHCQRRWGGG